MVLEFFQIVAADDVDLVTVAAAQRAQPILVAEPRAAVLFHHPLVEAQPRRARRPVQIQLVVVEVRVTSLQQLAGLGLQGDACMPEGMTNQRHERKVDAGDGERSHTIKAEPVVAPCGSRIGLPTCGGGPLLWPEALACFLSTVNRARLPRGTRAAPPMRPSGLARSHGCTRKDRPRGSADAHLPTCHSGRQPDAGCR